VSEENSGRSRVRLLAKILVVILVLAVNIACVMTVVSLVDSGTATPVIYVGGLDYTNNGNTSAAYVSISGTVVNPSSLAAKNVTLLLDVYDQRVIPPVASTSVHFGTIPENSSVNFNTSVSYSGGYFYDFEDGYYGIDSGLDLQSRFDFGLGFYVIALSIAVLLPVLDVYSAYRLGLFGWIKARKRLVLTTLVWAGIIALLVCLRFWLFYAANPTVGLTNLIDVYPQLYVSDWVLVFFLGIGAGVFIADLGVAVYSFLVMILLSSIFEVSYGGLFAWYDLGYSGSFSMIIPGMSFTAYAQSVLMDVLLNVLRMVNVAVPCFCALGVFIGVFARSYFDPSVDV
jgi:hypothetical protein